MNNLTRPRCADAVQDMEAGTRNRLSIFMCGRKVFRASAPPPGCCSNVTSVVPLAKNLHECEGRSMIFHGLNKASEGRPQWRKTVVLGEAVLRWTNIEETIVVKRSKLAELAQGRNCCISESEYNLAWRSIKGVHSMSWMICGGRHFVGEMGGLD